MSRIPKIRCIACDKVSYRSQEQDRAALGTVMQGAWRGKRSIIDYSLMAYPCPVDRKKFHIGHSSKTIKAIETHVRAGKE